MIGLFTVIGHLIDHLTPSVAILRKVSDFNEIRC